MRRFAREQLAPHAAQWDRDKTFPKEALQGLAGSLSERGVIQPILVRPVAGGTYEIVAGERRWRAAQLAGLEQIPAVVREHDDAASLEVALVENMAREDLNPVEEARACSLLVEELGLTREELGRRVGRSRVAVSNLMRLLDLPDEALDLLETGQLTEGHGRALLQVKGQDRRRSLARAAADGGWSVREMERRVKAEGGGGPKLKALPHPDEEAAIGRAEDALERALGREVRVSSGKRGLTAQIRFEDLDELIELADSLRRT